MESMRRGEANHSHHPNKVAINSLATDSNKQAITSNVSGSTLNNNKISFNNQQHTSSLTESKESNFEYDDNEWDVGGIGDLIIDLDNDIEQSSGSSIQQISSDISSSSSSLASLSSPSSSSNTIANQATSIGSTHLKQVSKSLLNSNVHSSLNPRVQKTSSFAPIAAKQQLLGASSSVISNKQKLLLNASGSAQQQHQQHHHHHHQQPKSSTLIAQLNSSRQINLPEAVQNNVCDPLLSNMSNPGNQNAGKAGTKISIDHQSLKMKIKRTKPGTKTSEAKHEIVKADMQNGTISGADDSSSSTSSGGKNQRTQISASPSIVPSAIVSATTASVIPNAATSQATKRGSSGHRRDKMKEKTPHSQRDKNEQQQTQQQQTQQQQHQQQQQQSQPQQPQQQHNNLSQTNERSCNCLHDAQMNGTQSSCTNGSCVRNRTIDQGTIPLSQRIVGSQSSSNSTTSTNSSTLPAAAISTGIFAVNSTPGSTGISAGGAPNTPGPPKDGKITPLVFHSATQMTTSSTIAITSIQQTPSTITSSNSSMKSTISSSLSSTSSNSSSCSTSNCDERTNSPPPKKVKCEPKDMVDVCVGTSVGTITEPDCLGPCEPGTSVTLEGIVWHETEGGVLVVNVTWRGKTYVGTLLDCTRHDWAPPRFCDSPTEELDSRTPKGRGKRGRSAAQQPSNDLSNFTETRSSVHSKLRNGGAKGRGGRTTAPATSTTNTPTTTTAVTSITSTSSSANNSANNTTSNTPSTSPTAFLPPRPEKRKSKDESPSPVNGENGTQSLINPLTGLNVQIPTKKVKTATPCAISPVLLECPEQDCSKKYKHANGLKYHQSHAHGAGSMDEDSQQPPESPRAVLTNTPSPAPGTPQPATTSAQCQISSSTSPPVQSSSVSNSTITSSTASINSTTQSAQQASPSSIPTIPIPASIPIQSINTGLLTTVSLPPNMVQSSTNQQSPLQAHPVAGGSITTGIASAAMQHQQQIPQPLIVSTNSNIIANQSITDSCLSPLPTSQHQQQSLVNNIVQTPTRPDAQVKPGVLRFGPPSDVEINRLSGNSSIPTSINQSPLRPTTVSSFSSVTGPQNTSADSTNSAQYIGNTQSNNQPLPIVKPQKKRKEGLTDYENTATNREDVQSPAYSDISDDSTPVVEPENIDKSQNSKHSEIVKKTVDGGPTQLGPLGGYGMYPFYTQPPYLIQPTDHSNINKSGSQSLSSAQDYNKVKEPPLDLMTKPQSNDSLAPPKESNTGPTTPQSKFMSNYYPYNYMPPSYSYNIDTNYGAVSMVSDESKQTSSQQPQNQQQPVLHSQTQQQLGQQQQQQQQQQIHQSHQQHQPTSHPHHPQQQMQQHQQLPQALMQSQPQTQLQQPSQPLQSQQQPHSLKEERLKESPSPKTQPQMIPTKLIKNEPPSIKDGKPEMSHQIHPKEHNQPLGPYSSIFQRHGLGITQQQHITREDELKRYYMPPYTDQRRSNSTTNTVSTNLQSTIKEEPQSPSQPIHPSIPPSQLPSVQSSPQQQSSQQSQQPHHHSQSHHPQQQQHKSMKTSSSQNISQQKSSSLLKDIKSEDKDTVKIKQEGQKPTMETQGPPPPPTSQYYIHPSYMGPSPFAFDPGHPMYRNMIVPAPPYNASPYHLQMARFHAPEDLSRNPNTKALDLLQHHANQYYNTHKIHELSERALKSPTSNVKVSVSSPNVSQQSSTNSNVGIAQSNPGSGGLNLQPASTSMPPGSGSGPLGPQKSSDKPGIEPSGKDGSGRSPPPQRHVHTHHHTHVGLGYPMYPAPYGAAVLASQQAAAVAVINPFPPGPTK